MGRLTEAATEAGPGGGVGARESPEGYTGSISGGGVLAITNSVVSELSPALGLLA